MDRYANRVLSVTHRGVVGAYSARAAEYVGVLGSIDATAVEDQRLVGEWGRRCEGTVVDAGCGPGHWTAFLRAQGVAASGIDPVREFIEHAKSAHPEVEYQVGGFADLPADGCGGVLAWYSMIHLAPDELPGVLMSVRRALKPRGRLLLGFFEGDRVESFDHGVTTGWFWPVDEMTRQLTGAGLVVANAEQRHDPGARPHAAIEAVRLA